MRTSLVLTFVALLSRAMGLGRDLAVTWAFGATADTDSFYIASSLSNAAYVVIAASLTSATIPFLSGHLDETKQELDFNAVSNILNIIFIALSVLAVVGMFGSGGLARLIAAGSSDYTITSTTKFMFVLMPTIVLLGAAGVLSGILNYHQVFVPVAAAPAVLNFSVISSVVILSRSQGIYSAVIGTFVGSVAFILMQLPVLYQVKYRHNWRISITDGTVFQFFSSAVPVTAVALLTYAYTFVDISIGTKLGEGAVTAINVATKLIQLPQGVIAMGLTTASFPTISRLVWANRLTDASWLSMRLAIVIVLISVPVSALMMIESDLIVSIIFGHGIFSNEAARETTRILALMVLSLPAFSLNILLLRVFYAMKRWHAPIVAFLVAFVIKCAMAFILVGIIGADTVAISTIVAVNLNALMLIVYLNGCMKRPFGSEFWWSVTRIGAVSFLAGVLLYLVRKIVFPNWHFPYSDLAAFVLLSVTGIILVLGLAFLLLRKEIGFLKSLRSSA